MPKRSRLYRVAGLSNRQRRSLLQEQQQQPGINEVEDLQKAYGRLFNQVNKYISQLQNITNLTRGLDRQISEIAQAETAWRMAGRAASLYIQVAGRSIRSVQAFGREGRNLVNILRSTARESISPIRNIRSFGRSLNGLRGGERPLQAIRRTLQQTTTVLGRNRRGAEQARASFDLLSNTARGYGEVFRALNQHAKETDGVLSRVRRAIIRLVDTDFSRQFSDTFRTGNIEISRVNNNSKRLAATFGLILRPLGIIRNEYIRLTRGRHRRFLAELTNVYVSVRNLVGEFQRLAGASANLINNTSAFSRSLNRLRHASGPFQALGIALNIVTFSLHGLVELTIGYRRNLARLYLAFEAVANSSRDFFNYIRSQDAATDFPGVRNSLRQLNAETRELRDMYREVRIESDRAFDTARLGAIALENNVERVNRRLTILGLQLLNLRPRRGPNQFEAILDRATREPLRRDPNVSRSIRGLTAAGPPPPDRSEQLQDIFKRLEQSNNRIFTLLATRGIRVTLPTSAQLGNVTGRRTSELSRARALEQELSNAISRAFVLASPVFIRRRRSDEAFNLGEDAGLSLVDTRRFRVGQEPIERRDPGTTQRIRTLGPEPDFSDLNATVLQRIRRMFRDHLRAVVEEEPDRQRGNNETLNRLKLERNRIRQQERAIRDEQRALENTSLFDTIQRDTSRVRRGLPEDEPRSRRTSSDVERERRRRQQRDEPGSLFDFDPNRLGAGLGFLRFGEDAEPVFDRLTRGIKRVRRAFDDLRSGVRGDTRLFSQTRDDLSTLRRTFRLLRRLRILRDRFNPLTRSPGLFGQMRNDIDTLRTSYRLLRRLETLRNRFTSFNSNRLNSGLGFLRFGEDAEPVFDRVVRGTGRASRGINRLRRNLNRANATSNVTVNRLGRMASGSFDLGKNLFVLSLIMRGIFLYSLVGAGAALVFFTSRMAETVRELDLLRLRLGLSAQTFRAWQFVAAETGFALGDIRRIFDDLDKQVQNLVKGQAEAVTLFTKLNISLNDLKGLDIGGIFQVVADRLGNVSSQTERIALATALFGEQAFKALQLASRGGDAIADALNRYQNRQLGTAAELQNIRRLDAAFKRLQLTLQEVGVTLTSAIADRLIRGLAAFERILRVIERADTETIRHVVDSFILFFKILAVIVTSAIIVRIGTALLGLTRVLLGLRGASRSAGINLRGLANIGKSLIGVFGRQGLATVLLAVTLPLIAKALSNIQAFQLNIDQLAASIPEPDVGDAARIDPTQILRTQLRNQGEIQDAIIKRQERFSDERFRINQQLKQRERELLDILAFTPRQRESTVFQTYQQEVEIFNRTLSEARREAFRLQQEVERRIDFGLEVDPRLTRELEVTLRFIKELQSRPPIRLFDETQNFDEYLDRLQRSADLVGRYNDAVATGAQAVGRFISTSITLFDDFSEHIGAAARQLAQDIFNALQDALVAQPIVQFLTQFAQAGALALANRFAPGTPNQPIDFAQHGGVHSGLTVVGERGPELLNIGNPSRIVPNRDLGSLLGGFTQNNVFNISGSDPETVRNAIVEAAPYLTEAAKQGIIADSGRPSQLRRALRS